MGSLSDKEQSIGFECANCNNCSKINNLYKSEDVIEFIKELKDLFDVEGRIVMTKEMVWCYIDKLAGEKLCMKI